MDLTIIKNLCSVGVPFTALRNPEFANMLLAMNKAPEGDKPPSYEKPRTSLLDECKRSLQRDLIPIQETWYTQGVPVLAVNVLAVNSRG